ncbi:MAG: LysE family translocator [Alphaproteobacteria bacterium]
MSWDQGVAFVVFVLVASGTPGPSNVLLTATGARVGILRGLPVQAGVLAGMGTLIFTVAFGLGSFVLENPRVLEVLKYCGAAFLLWLAWKIARSGPVSVDTDRPPVGFFGAAAFQWVNPKSWLVSASAAGTYLQAGTASAAVQAGLFALIFVVAAAPTTFLWLGFGAAVQRILRTPRAHMIFNWTMAGLLAASVVLFVL